MIYWELCKKLKFDHTNKWYMHNSRICPRERDTQTPLGFRDTNGSLNLDQTTRFYINEQQEKRTFRIVDFTISADYRVKLNECEKRDKYRDLAREMKKLWNMKVTIIPIVIGALSTVTKGLVQGLEDLEITGRVETIQITALMRLARILRRVLEIWGDLLSWVRIQWEIIS